MILIKIHLAAILYSAIPLFMSTRPRVYWTIAKLYLYYGSLVNLKNMLQIDHRNDYFITQ